MRKHYEIDLRGLNLDQATNEISSYINSGRYIFIIDSFIEKRIREIFNYELSRIPRHNHFKSYGKEIYSIDYIGCYLFPYKEDVHTSFCYKTGVIKIYNEIK